MKNRSNVSFYAKFLGGFSLHFGDREIPIDINPQTKYMQILIRLLKAGAEGIERMDLMDTIWPEETDLAKRMNNFRAQRFLLRKMIDRLAFPEGTYILRRKNRYYFSFEYAVETDTGHLDELIYRIQADDLEENQRQKLLWQFFQSYSGGFLPALGMEAWVVGVDAYYRRWYTEYASELCEALKRQKNFEKMLELCTAASRIYPYDEWQLKQIECLIALDRQAEAAAVYEQALQIYNKDMGTTVLDKAMEPYSSGGKAIYCAANVLSDIQDKLKEHQENEQGGYYCSYPSFLDAYHLAVRLGGRLKMESLLMICTLVKKEGEAVSTFKTMAEDMKRLWQALMSSIQRDHIFTRYSSNQFVVLLLSVKKEDSEKLIQRLEDTWKQLNQNKNLTMVLEVVSVKQDQLEEKLNYENNMVCRIECG